MEPAPEPRWALDDTRLDLNYPQVGKCHVCRGGSLLVLFCPLCGHWMCDACRWRLSARGLEAAKELMGLTRPNCCGPAYVRMVWNATIWTIKHSSQPIAPVKGKHWTWGPLTVAAASNLSNFNLFGVWYLRWRGRWELAVTRVWDRRVNGDVGSR